MSTRFRAFSAWTPPAIAPGKPTSVPHRELLRRVTTGHKANVHTTADVSEPEVLRSRIGTQLERPRSVDPNHATAPWFPQLETAFLLDLRDAFIGDNVVFDDSRYFDLDRWWLGHSAELYSGVDEVRRIDAGVSIGAWGGEAFQHFVVDALPRLSAIIGLLESPDWSHVAIVTHSEGAAAARWFWQELGLTERVVQKPLQASEGFVVHANRVLYTDVEPSLNVLGVYPRGVLEPLQDRLGVLEPVARDRVLYLTREGQMRRVADESTLLSRIEETLTGTGLKLEIFRHRSLDEDREVVRRAHTVIGPHGGAFANLVFAQPGTAVVEFLPIYENFESDDSRVMYWGLAQAAGLDYWTVSPERFGFEDDEIVVDPASVVAVLRRILATGN